MPHRTLMSLNTLALSPSSQNLWRVVLIRLLVLLAQSISVMAAYLSGWVPLPWTSKGNRGTVLKCDVHTWRRCIRLQ